MSSVIRGADNFDSGRFTSAEQTITSGGLLTLPHGLGVAPFMVQALLVCITAEHGYLIGDEVIVTNTAQSSSAANNYGISIVSDSTNLYVRFGSNSVIFLIANKTTGASGDITLANWKLRIKAIA